MDRGRSGGMRDWHNEGCQDRGIQVLRGEILSEKAGGDDAAMNRVRWYNGQRLHSKPAGRPEYDGDDMTLKHKNGDREFESRAGV